MNIVIFFNFVTILNNIYDKSIVTTNISIVTKFIFITNFLSQKVIFFVMIYLIF